MNALALSLPETLIGRRDGALLRLTLNRPGSLNALDKALYHALADALAAAEADDEIAVVLIDGAGESFCAGNDLHDFLDAGDRDEALAAPRRLLEALASFSKPLVARVQGHAVGIGTTLLLHCDLVLCRDDARFALPFTRLGLVPEGGSSLLLPGLVGHPRAFEWLVMGEPCDAEEARRLGLVNAVLPGEALDAAVERYLTRLLALPQAAVCQSKALLRAPRREALAEVMREELAAFAERLESPEAQAALRSMLEKRR